ncbi:replication protein A 32 kDa subunit-like [Sphaeramia orbicularis]|uniref:replication protein A 32 kDa subunit-like n=1 Tax=Sphaeramia orbicularis TaxID=375764 RepID=UPI00117D9CEB|nr:replication protein A 32 kDa subunit-like [Sphaeramia orbicularis]
MSNSSPQGLRAALQILPCTVSQLLSAAYVTNDSFAICDLELNQVSVVGIIRRLCPSATDIQYFVDDMTGPPLNVKQWVNIEGSAGYPAAAIGTYVKVNGSLRNIKGQKSLLAMNIRCIKDLNEITSHMLEVVNAHMQLFGKACDVDVNMNTTAASSSGVHTNPKGLNGSSTTHSQYNHASSAIRLGSHHVILHQVLQVIRRFREQHFGISFQDLKTHLYYISVTDIRKSLAFLMNKGHVFHTTDEHHFKSSEY